MSETLIPITRFLDECDHTTRGHDKRDALTWNQLSAMLTSHARRVAKSGPGWAPVTFVDALCTCGSPKCPGDRGHRIDENVIALHALTLDVDKTTAVKASERRQLDHAGAERALDRLGELGLRHVAHTTHSHAYPDRASYRVTIALSRSVHAEEWPRFYAAAMAYLDIPHDPASRNTARFWYLPSCRPDAVPLVIVRDGQALDVEMVMGISRAAAVAVARTTVTKLANPRPGVPGPGDFDIRDLMAAQYPVRAEPGRADVDAQWHIGLHCPWRTEHTSPDVPTSTTVFLYKSGAWTFKCLHSHCEGRDERDFRRFHEPGWVPFDERSTPVRRPTRGGPPQVLGPHGDASTDVEADPETAAIRAEQLGELVGADAHPHSEEQRADAGDPKLPNGMPPDVAPPPGDQDAPPSQRARIDPRRTRPEIVLSTDQPAIVDAAERALATMSGVYVRGRQLVHVVRDHGAPDWWKRPDGAPVIAPIARDHLLDLLCRAATWRSKYKGKLRDTSPPTWVAARLLARGQWKLPQLEGIADAPVFRANGTIHDHPGYDPETRMIYDPGRVVFQTVPQKPTQDDARRALVELLEPFDEFPFVAESDRAATAAAILSVVGRAAILGNVPMFSSQAPTPGSGKGLLVEIVSVIATGRMPPLMAPTDDEDEIRKRLMAIAMESPTMVVIDNVEREIGSAALAMALTAGVVTDRKFGDNTKMITASLRPVWVMTGNNVQLKGDLGRRVVPIDLDPKCEHPEDRTFRRRENLIDYVQATRPRLVVAALTVLRAFVVATRPAHPWPPKGSFDSWSELVRGAIAHAGGADPLGGVQRIREQGDEDLDKLRALLCAWHDKSAGTVVTVSKAIQDAGKSGDLHDALVAYCRSGLLEGKPIGNALRKVRGRPANKLVLERMGEDRKGIALWRVGSTEREPAAGSAGSAGSTSCPTGCPEVTDSAGSGE